MSAGYDAEVADLFRDLRAASNLTEADLAARIATPVEVVQALEQGAIYALPPWPETCRVVSAYGTLLNLDTRPLLRRIYAQLEAGVVELGPKPVQDVPVMVPPAATNPAAAPAALAPLPSELAPGLANGMPQPQGAPQAAPATAPQQETAQTPPQTSAWPSAPAPAPQAAPSPTAQPQLAQPLQPQAPQPQAAQPQAGQPLASQPLQPQPSYPQPQAAPQPEATPRAPSNPLDLQWPGAAPASQPAEPVAPQPAVQQAQTDARFPDAVFPGEPQSYAQAPVPEQPSPQQPSLQQPSSQQPYLQQPSPQPAGVAPDPHAPLDPALVAAQMPEDASFLDEPELELVEEEEAETKSSKSPLLKWGIVGLLAVVLLLGLWMVFGGSTGDGSLSSGFNTSDPVLDPDDPRSRKADRLPNNF